MNTIHAQPHRTRCRGGACAKLLLAAFMVSILGVWAVALMDHAGMFGARSHAGVAR